MTRAKPVTIGERKFPSKTAAIRFLSAMLNKYELLARVSDDHATILRHLFAGHPESENKLRGYEITHFEVHPFVKGSRCFFLCRSDGTKQDFSFSKCIDALEKLQRVALHLASDTAANATCCQTIAVIGALSDYYH